jgi:SAM-dependent methyltransferase
MVMMPTLPRYNTPMPDSVEFWDFYWELKLQEMEDLGKREAILAASRLVRSLAEHPGQPVRLLELGCGEGQILGSLAAAHSQVPGMLTSCGVDYSPRAITRCRRTYPDITFLEGDFTQPETLAHLGQFAIVLLVNALHEVFSAGYAPALGEVDVPAAKDGVARALALAVERLVPGGYLVLFDGLEPAGDLLAPVRVRFQHAQARRRFDTFVREYRPFKISARPVAGTGSLELSYRDFTRYITKSIFLEKSLWETERLESYQYFTETEFRDAIRELGLVIREQRTLTVDYEKWRAEVEILTPGVDFPAEHILILAQKPGQLDVTRPWFHAGS